MLDSGCNKYKMGNTERKKFCQISTIWLPLLVIAVSLTKSVSGDEPRVVCYYTNWSVYRPGTARFNPQNINPYLCTHLIYAFGGFTKENTLKPFDKYQDIEKGGYAKFNGLKTYNKELKTLLALGGWNEGSARFSQLVASRDRRREFTRNAIKFLRQNRFDGLDLDWEYPAFRDGGRPKDRENYAKLVKELREEFEREAEATGKPRLLLTMAVPAGVDYVRKGFDVKTLNRYLDWMNLLSYDYHSAFEPAVNHHAPLYPLEAPSEYSVDNELNIDYTIKYYLEQGADPNKLVLGIPTYGRSYTLLNPDAAELGAPADGPGEQGDATREKGYLAYYEICESLKPKKTKRSTDSDSDEESDDEEQPWTVVHPHPGAMGPVAVRGTQWVGYDDMDIVKKKAEYVAENGLGGIMFWSIDNDDFRGACHGKPYPLIEAAKESYFARLGSTNDVAVAEKPRPQSSGAARRRARPRPSTTASPTTRAAAKQASSTPAWNNTPAPPTTPDPGTDFKCTDEGFFPHPRDCKKYFWCLDSGPSNLGIVAHHFTCPSGLFFNKAADSCDFARNVLCKKPSATTKAPATSTTTTTTAEPTTRRAVKLSTKSSALFRTTTTTTTTTTPEPEPEEEYEEYSDPADVDAEDPKVIKELIDLIRKVGGVEQLEKQLQRAEAGAGTTTLAPVNKKLYQKVLERTRASNKIISNSISDVQNSRRPPPAGPAEDLPDRARARPQYTTINRGRASTPEPESEDESDEDTPPAPASASPPASPRPRAAEDKGKPLQYVNIRRARPTGDTADDTASRNALFERNEPVVSLSGGGGVDVSARRDLPEYVTIRRQRPAAADVTTAQYETDDEEKSFDTLTTREESSSPATQPQYISIVRSRPSTTEPDTPEPTTAAATATPTTTEEVREVEEAPTTVSEAPSTSRSPPRRVPSRRRGTTTTTSPAPSTTVQAQKDRRTNFLRRTKGTASPAAATEPAPPETTAATPAAGGAKYSRRGGNRFKSQAGKKSSEGAAAKNGGKIYTRPSLNATTASERPGRVFARRRGAGGGNVTTTEAPSTPRAATRRPFRVASRRRPATATTAAATTTTTTTTTAGTTAGTAAATTAAVTTDAAETAAPTTTVEATTLASEEFLQDIENPESLEDPSLSPRGAAPPRRTVKIQRRPLTSLRDSDQNPEATNERAQKELAKEGKRQKEPPPKEEKRQSKKFSSSFKQNQLDEVLLQKSRSHEEGAVTGRTDDDFSAETAVAIAAHQLLSAPLPAAPDRDDGAPPPRPAPAPAPRARLSTPRPFASTRLPTTIVSEEFPTREAYSSTPKYTVVDYTAGYTTANFLGGGFTISPPLGGSLGGSLGGALGPSTARYQDSSRPLRVPVDFGPEPEYFTREYLLESPVTRTFDDEYQYLTPATEAPRPPPRRISTTLAPTAAPAAPARRPHAPAPAPAAPARAPAPRAASRRPFEKVSRPLDEYYAAGADAAQYGGDTKVVVHESGTIQCLDIGNFPHPSSCNKFISCARMERGALLGWEYQCPRGLSFDPVGGLCNWAAGLGCPDA